MNHILITIGAALIGVGALIKDDKTPTKPEIKDDKKLTKPEKSDNVKIPKPNAKSVPTNDTEELDQNNSDIGDSGGAV